MDKDEILIKEYETCQSHNNNLGNQTWLSFSIAFSANVVLLAGIGYALIQKSTNLEPIFAYMALVLFIIICIFLFLLMRWRSRVKYLLGVNHMRMRRIEDEILDRDNESSIIMEKTWLVYGYDRKVEYDKKKDNIWCGLSDDRKLLIETIGNRYLSVPEYSPPTDKYFNKLYLVITLPWILLIVIAFLLAYCL